MTESASSIHVVINASAGSGCDAGWVDTLAEKFRAGGLEAKITLAKNGDEILQAAKNAVKAHPKIIVAGGGDGTINAVASAVVGSDITFGVLPMGTLNHFAKDLNIPLKLEEAAQNIIDGHTQKVDVGEINERIFLNNSSLGIYPNIVRDREAQQRRLGRGKWLAFFWATLATLRRYPFMHIWLTIDGVEHERHTPFVFIGNNPYLMEGFSIGKRERLDSGKLSLYSAQRTGRLGLFGLALRALFGTLRQARDFDELTAQSVRIETRHQHIRVSTDGEVNLLDTPLHYRIRPAALNVIVPKK